jgi:hypothetical protein
MRGCNRTGPLAFLPWNRSRIAPSSSRSRFIPIRNRVRRFRLKNFVASKRNEAKRDSFRFVFACLSENRGPIFSLLFASFRFKFFVSLRSEKKNLKFSLHFASLLFIFSSFPLCSKKKKLLLALFRFPFVYSIQYISLYHKYCTSYLPSH